MSNVIDSTFDCFSFCEEEFEKPTVMSRGHSNSSNSTQESVSAFISSAGSPFTEQVFDDQQGLFDFCGSIEYVPIPDFQNFEYLQDQNSSEMMLKQSKKIKKEKVQKGTPKKNESSQNKQKDSWKPEEDAQLVALYVEFGPKWSQIASCMGTRTGKQIRDRYTNMLRPGISHAEWTPEEEKLLFSLCEQFGNKWCKIASYLPGRTEYQVKNKFYWEKRKEAALSDKSTKAPQKSPKGQGQMETVDNFLENEAGAYFMTIDQAFSDSFKEVKWTAF